MKPTKPENFEKPKTCGIAHIHLTKAQERLLREAVAKGIVRINGRRLIAADVLKDFDLASQHSTMHFLSGSSTTIKIKATERGERWVARHKS